MHFHTSCILTISALMGIASSAAYPAAAVANVYPREIAAAQPYWNFTIYDRANCNATYSYDEQSYQGTGNAYPQCGPPSFFQYVSVFIGATKGGKCRIAFYGAGGTSKGCMDLIGDPSAAKPGQCYNFNPNDQPTTFNVTCTS